MRTIGLLHGMSSVATVDYYRRINDRVNELRGGHERAELVLSSVNFGVIERCVRAEAWDEAGQYLAGKARGLQRAGADFIACGSNTMHRVAPVIEAAITVPFLHIAAVVATTSTDIGVTRLGLLGTAPTMEQDFYRRRLERAGFTVLPPEPVDRTTVDQIIFDELTRHVFRPESRETYIRVMTDLHAAGAEAIVLGCTEIILLVGPDDVPGLPLLDSTTLHVEAIVQTAMSRG